MFFWLLWPVRRSQVLSLSNQRSSKAKCKSQFYSFYFFSSSFSDLRMTVVIQYLITLARPRTRTKTAFFATKNVVQAIPELVRTMLDVSAISG